MTQFTGYSRKELVEFLSHYEEAITGPAADNVRLLGELPLHQVELELQNRDLIETQQALEEARDRYAELYDFAPVGYLSLERGGTICNLNLTACAMLQEERQALLGMPFRSFLAGDCQRPFFSLLQRAFDSGETVSDEFQLAFDSDRTIHLECRLHGEPDGTRTCLTIATDVTDRKRAELALQGEKAFLQHLIDGIDSPILVIAPDYKVLRMNAAAHRVADAAGLEGGCLTCHQVTHRSDTPCDGEDHPCPLRSVMRTRRPMRVVHNHVNEDGTTRKIEVAVSPLFDDAGHMLGVIEVNRDVSEHIELLDALKARDLRFEFLAQHDVLTELPNRVLFADRLRHAMKTARRGRTLVGVLFIDLDRFKEINDSFGHSTGDQVLVEVAARLKTLFRENDTVARMGGDEFTVILSTIRRPEDAGLVAHKILKLFDEPFLVQKRQLRLGASIGISVYPQHGETVEDLVRNADSAMYEAKDGGRMSFHYYSAELTARAFERIALESSLCEALERDDFIIHYQPQFSLETGAVIGLEALVRWQTVEGQLVAPERFIATAEATGQIVSLDQLVMRRACGQMKAWMDTGMVPTGIPISINLSGRLFDSGELIDTVAEVLEETRLDPGSLELELTESAMMRDVEQSAGLLRQLRDQGVMIAVDDFGTGYSSLAYLKSLPITRLKIDRMFVSDIHKAGNGAAITKAIISLGRTLDLDLLGEGIETDVQRQFLLDEGCRAGQGFWFSAPLPEADFERFAAERNRR